MNESVWLRLLYGGGGNGNGNSSATLLRKAVLSSPCNSSRSSFNFTFMVNTVFTIFEFWGQWICCADKMYIVHTIQPEWELEAIQQPPPPFSLLLLLWICNRFIILIEQPKTRVKSFLLCSALLCVSVRVNISLISFSMSQICSTVYRMRLGFVFIGWIFVFLET